MPEHPRPQEVTPERIANLTQHAYDLLDALPLCYPSPGDKIVVILFKDSGKYYTEEEWTVTGNVNLGPSIMSMSPDFRRIGNGKVLVPTRYWGFPHLI